MSWRFVYRVLPVLVIRTDRLIPARFQGYNLGPVILLRPTARAALLEHELTHSRQVYRTLFLMGAIYYLSKRWRLRWEAEAYAVQWKAGDSLANLSTFLANNYHLGISVSEAQRAILGAALGLAGGFGEA
ncbi:hypothetical protein [Cupriavidus basilensis]|uniref:Uncharacterized protein n=1 Tax=Cupriavidus basilensis TaxID=68895 RepID=A0A0C4Y796_9BURK|nr:hypothetical protein [Cupriavidus basilensis]AJG18798.1 hypothetical protein RR42_m1396 [Cupriavidus basilensis]